MNDRDKRIAEMWNAGMSSGAISQRLLIDVSTINMLVKRMRDKGVELRRSKPTTRARQVGL